MSERPSGSMWPLEPVPVHVDLDSSQRNMPALWLGLVGEMAIVCLANGNLSMVALSFVNVDYRFKDGHWNDLDERP